MSGGRHNASTGRAVVVGAAAVLVLALTIAALIAVAQAAATSARAEGRCQPAISQALQDRLSGAWPLPRADRAEWIQR